MIALTRASMPGVWVAVDVVELDVPAVPLVAPVEELEPVDEAAGVVTKVEGPKMLVGDTVLELEDFCALRDWRRLENGLVLEIDPADDVGVNAGLLGPDTDEAELGCRVTGGVLAGSMAAARCDWILIRQPYRHFLHHSQTIEKTRGDSSAPVKFLPHRQNLAAFGVTKSIFASI